MKVPGIKVFQDMICDKCREIHGDSGAVDRMTECVRDAIRQALESWPNGEEHRIHVVVTHETGCDDDGTV